MIVAAVMYDLIGPFCPPVLHLNKVAENNVDGRFGEHVDDLPPLGDG